MDAASGAWSTADVSSASGPQRVRWANAQLGFAAGTATRSLEMGEVGEVLRALRPGVEVTDWSKVCTTDQLCQLVEESLRLVRSGSRLQRECIVLNNGTRIGSVLFGVPHFIAIVFEVGPAAGAR